MTVRILHRAGPVTAAGAGALLVFTACAAPGGGPGAVGPPEQRYQTTATVLESGRDGPQLCHAVMDSYPPQCGGPQIEGWDWDTVPHESAMGVRWGGYTLVGTWDGERFTLTEPARAPEPDDHPAPDLDFSSPCEEPPGGWQPVDPDTATFDAQQAALERAAQAPDYAGAWLDRSQLAGLDDWLDRGDPGDSNDSGDRGEPPDLAPDEAGSVVLNLRFTADLDERERWIREVWGGPLCVTGADHTEQELLAIQRELLDLEDVTSSGIDVVANALRVQVFVASPQRQRDLDERFGEGAVILDGLLRPVD